MSILTGDIVPGFPVTLMGRIVDVTSDGDPITQASVASGKVYVRNWDSGEYIVNGDAVDVSGADSVVLDDLMTTDPWPKGSPGANILLPCPASYFPAGNVPISVWLVLISADDPTYKFGLVANLKMKRLDMPVS